MSLLVNNLMCLVSVRSAISWGATLLLILCVGFHPSVAQDRGDPSSEADEQLLKRMISGEIPAADFEVSLPGGGGIDRNGAFNIPEEGIVLTSDFAIRHPSKIVLPAGTRIIQKGERVWGNLHVIGPDGTRVEYTRDQIAGVRIVTDEAWSEIKVVVPPLGDAAQAVVDSFDRAIPDLNGLFKLLGKTRGLTEPDLRRVLTAYIQLQKPRLSTAEIVELYGDLRKGISTLDGKWTVNSKAILGTLSDYNRIPLVSVHFMMDGAKLYLAADSKLDDASGQVEKLVRSYDGAQEREYVVVKEFARGSIRQFSGRSAYYNHEHVLWTSMLIDSETDLAESGGNNISEYRFYPLEKLVNIRGVLCIPCLTLNMRVFYLDPSRGYCLVADDQPFQFDSEQGTIVPANRRLDTQVLDHVQCAEGLWLPKEVRRIWYENGDPILEQSIKYSDVTVNQPIAHERFEKVIPQGILTVDVRTGKSSNTGRFTGRPIDGARPIGWIMLINVLLIVLAGAAVARRRLRSRPA